MERAAFQCLQIFAAQVMKFCLSLCFPYNNFAVTLIQNVFGPKRTSNWSTPCLLSLNDKFDNNTQTSIKSSDILNSSILIMIGL